MSMKMRIQGGKTLEITDDNKTIVTADIAEEINEKLIQADDKNSKPDLTIKD